MKNQSIIYCDAAENTVRRSVNRFGKIKKFDNGGHRIGLHVTFPDGKECTEQFFNKACPDQFAGECFAVLKAVEFAKENGLPAVVIRNDRIASFSETTKRGYKGATYLWIAQKMAAEAGIEVEFDRCTSAENLADGVAREDRSMAKPVPAVVSPPVAVQASAPAPSPLASRSARGAEYDEWFAAHTTQWPAIRDGWKAEGLSSRERDERLAETVKSWAAAGKPVAE